jgi:hypothetical protein
MKWQKKLVAEVWQNITKSGRKIEQQNCCIFQIFILNMKLWECSLLYIPPCQLRTGSSLVTRFVQYVFLPENIYRVKEDGRKIRLIEGNAKCHHLKN